MSTPRTWTFLLTLTDQPGGMEIVAATFAHRGISLVTTLGQGGQLDPAGRATVVVQFEASERRKEALRRALTRLSRVLEVREYAGDSPRLRKAALVRLAPDATPPVFAAGEHGWIDPLAPDTATGESLWLVVGLPDAVDRVIAGLHAAGGLRGVTHSALAV